MRAIRVTAFVAFIGLVVGVAAVGDAGAGESGKVVFRDVMFAASFPSAKVPDVEGHVIYLVDAKGIHFNDKCGVASAVNIGTTEYIKGVGPITGYYVYTFPDGSTITTRYEGEAKGLHPEAQADAEVKQSGPMQGVPASLKASKRGEPRSFWVVAPGLWYTEAEGEYTLP